MPVLKIKKDGAWEKLGGTIKLDRDNADTLDGKHASEFALASDVSEQINVAINDLREEILGGAW